MPAVAAQGRTVTWGHLIAPLMPGGTMNVTELIGGIRELCAAKPAPEDLMAALDADPAFTRDALDGTGWTSSTGERRVTSFTSTQPGCRSLGPTS
jgi:hypothetical protein